MFLLVLPTVTQTQPTNRGLGLTIPCELSPLAGKLKLLSLWMGTPDASKAYCRSRKVLTLWKDQTLSELPLLYKTLDIQHLVCTTYHLYNTSFVQNLYIQQLICTTLTFTTSHLYNTLDTQHLDIQHFKFNVQPLIWELLYHTFPFKHFYLKIGSNQKVRAG